MGDELARLDATAQAELVRNGEATAVELTEAAISRIEATNGEVNAVIHPLFEAGLEVAKGELPDGPFKGVPFLLKDLGAAFAGQPLHLGMNYLKERDFHAPVDTYLAERFRAAGLVTIGKTSCPELGILPTTEPRAYGPTRNPWDLDRSAGGSSGGSAAAVAAGMVPMAHANDGGGSIRIPAANCGLVGLKPSRQRTSEGPLAGDFMSGLTAELCVSKSVRDTAALLEAVHGPAPGDPYVAPPPARPYTEEVGADPGRLRIALWTETVIEQDADPEVVAAAEAGARALEGCGHRIERPDLSALQGLDMVEPFLVRWAAGQAQALDQLGMVGGRPITADDVEPLTWALAEIGRGRNSGEYLTAVGQHQVMSRLVAGIHESGFDLLLTPTLGEPPPPLGSFDDSGPDPMAAFERAFLSGCFTALFNATGQPAISLPLHWSEGGLPIGVQLVAPLGREDLLLRVASQLEQEAPWADRAAPTCAR
ncbi:MAG TPA: amidase [Solirubrobacterales bacterium]|nr:amidase [Solirubrobacterales bacterium]